MTTDNDTNPALDRPQQEAFQTYLNSGGHYIGIHSASDCLHDATFYGRELGAYMVDHLTLAEMVNKLHFFVTVSSELIRMGRLDISKHD